MIPPPYFRAFMWKRNGTSAIGTRRFVTIQSNAHVRTRTLGRSTSSDRFIATLDPRKFDVLHQRPISLADFQICQVFLENQAGPQVCRLNYACTRLTKGSAFKHLPFPAAAKGYLYYNTPPPNRPAISGSLRFRVIPDFPNGAFDNGYDLGHPIPHRPWEIHLLSIYRTRSHAPLGAKLSEESLVSQELIDSIQNLSRTCIHADSTVLFTIHDPFVLDLHSAHNMFSITPSQIVEAKQVRFFSRQHNGNGGFERPYEGTVLCRFEPSPLPEHANGRHVALRVLDILSPVNVIHPELTDRIALPEKGQFLHRRRRPLDGFKMYTLDLEQDTTRLHRLLQNLLSEGYGL